MSQRSIVLAIIIFSLIVFGMITFTFLELSQPSTLDENTANTRSASEQPTSITGSSSSTPDDQPSPVDTEPSSIGAGLSLAREYRGGTHVISGALQLPNPCYTVSTSTMVAESYPEQVTLHIDAIPGDSEICTPVIDERPISFRVEVAEAATFRVLLNGDIVPKAIPQLERTSQ